MERTSYPTPDSEQALPASRETRFAPVYDSFGYHWTPRMAELAEQAGAILPVPYLEDPSQDPALEIFTAFIDEAQRQVDEICALNPDPVVHNNAFIGFQLAVTELTIHTGRLQMARFNIFDLLYALNQANARNEIAALIDGGLLEDPHIPGIVPYSSEWQARGGVAHPSATERREEFEQIAEHVVETVFAYPDALVENLISLDPETITDGSVGWPMLQSSREVHLLQNALNRALLRKAGVHPQTTPPHREYVTKVYKADPEKGSNPEIIVTVYEFVLEEYGSPFYLHHTRPVNPRHTQLKDPVYPGWVIGPDIDM